MNKYFLLDTNVLIHNPQAIYSFAENNVIIPITVIEELDQFKSIADKKGMHARQVLREMDSLLKKGALKKGAKMSSGGTLSFAFLPEEEKLPGLNERFNDNKIIALAWHMQKEGKRVFFVSKDVNARIKAEALGIQAVDYEKQKVNYDQLYKGWRELILNSEKIDEIKAKNSMEYKEQAFLENEYVVARSENDPAAVDLVCKHDLKNNAIVPVSLVDDVLGIRPLNMEQAIALDLLLDDRIKLVTLVGQAGTGKTLIALACALSKVIGRTPLYERLMVVRPIVPLGKDIGYLPGSKEKKLNYWMQPIFDNLEFILKKAYTSQHKDWAVSDLTIDHLLDSDMIEIEALTYIRGRSIPNQFCIVDEAQNLTPHEIKTIISRAGEGTKIVLTGDPDQIDNPYLDANSNGLSYTVERLKKSGIFGHVLLSKSERSQLAALAVDEL